MDVAHRARGGLDAHQSVTPKGSRLALTLGPLHSCMRWHSRSVTLRPSFHICHAKSSLGLGLRTTVGTAGLAAFPSHEQRQRRGSTAVVCAGGPSGGLQKVKRVRSGEVNSTDFYPIARIPSCFYYQVLFSAALTDAVSSQVDTLGKKLLVGTAFAYVGLVLFIPFINVFVQVCFFPLVGGCLPANTLKRFEADLQKCIGYQINGEQAYPWRLLDAMHPGARLSALCRPLAMELVPFWSI